MRCNNAESCIFFFYLAVWQGLFYRVIGGEISPFRLVRLSPEELLSKEMSDWRKSEISEVKQDRICLGELRLNYAIFMLFA